MEVGLLLAVLLCPLVMGGMLTPIVGPGRKARPHTYTAQLPV
jgi:hypothetical protein